MKKVIIMSLVGLSFSLANAQDISDAVRYGNSNVTGTARYRAMGGAFTALGGDLSAISVNPAGSSVFNNDQFGLTLTINNTKNSASFFGTKTGSKENALGLNQGGGVFVFNNYDQSSKWKKFTLAANYEKTGNFVNQTNIRGINTNNSIGNYFQEVANGIELDLLQTLPNESASQLYMYLGENYGSRHQTAFLGYDTYLLDPVQNSLDNTLYISNVPQGSYSQQTYISETGDNGKLSFNFSTQYTDRFYFGLNLNSHMVDYTRSNVFYENNSNPMNSTGETVRDVKYQYDLHTFGTGFSFQLGAIAKITNEFRMGIAYESPTWFKLNDETRQGISVSRINLDDPNGSLLTGSFSNGIVNIYPEYKLRTPGKYTLGGAYVFGNIGLISIDYSLKDYSNSKFSSNNNQEFSIQNSLMNSVLDVTNEFRIGAESRYKKFSFRAGFNYEQSPYKNGNVYGDLTQGSLGLGYNFGSFKLDLAYSRAQRDVIRPTYEWVNSDLAKVKMVNNDVFLTFLFEL